MTGRHAQILRAALCASDAAAAVAAAVAGYTLRFHVLDAWMPVEGRLDVLPSRYALALPATVLLLLLATAAAGLYEPRRALRPPGAADVLRTSALAGAALATVALLYWREFQYSRATLLLVAALHGPAVAVARRAALAALRRRARASPPAPALLVGGGRPARALVAALAAGGTPSTRIDACVAVGEAPAGVRTVGGLGEACAGLGRGEWSEVYVAVPAESSAEVPAILARLEQVTADVRFVPDLGAATLVNASAAVVGGVAVVSLRERPLYGTRAAAKRAVDVVVSAALLVVTAPLLAGIAAAVRATSRGPALYAQERMGLGGREFRMWKFRTMRVGAEDESGPVFAKRGDPRVTAVGAFLRRFSLDELPQLWNVLRGDMSLVGPRPERPSFIEGFRARLPGYMLRHAVKAGMTGWAQVHGLRGDSSIEERLRYDLEYVDRWSLTLDLEILGRTAAQVVLGRNAY